MITWAMEAWGLPSKFLNVRLDTHLSWWKKEVVYVTGLKNVFIFFLFSREMFSKTAFVSL